MTTTHTDIRSDLACRLAATADELSDLGAVARRQTAHDGDDMAALADELAATARRLFEHAGRVALDLITAA